MNSIIFLMLFISTSNISAPTHSNIQYLSDQPSFNIPTHDFNLPGRTIPEVTTPISPPSRHNLPKSSPIPFTIIKNIAVTYPDKDYKHPTNEPSAASNSDYVFYTGNFYAARSIDGGSTFTYVNPFSDMPSFCCDQDTIYDKNHNIFIWYRQGWPDKNGENFFRLGISTDNTSSWFFYDIYPTNISSEWTNQFWDYPQLALSSSYLYVSSNMFDKNDTFVRSVILRIPLSALKSSAELPYNYYSDEYHASYAFTQGASSIMYFGTQHNNSAFHLLTWNDLDTAPTSQDISIPAWSPSDRNESICPGPDGINWCARTDDRVTTGWVTNGTIGFSWNVKQGSGFNYPFVYTVIFNKSDMTLAGFPVLYSNDYAFQYAATSPNIAGDIGISVMWGGGAYYPSHAVGIYNPQTDGWDLQTTAIGLKGNPYWGDYLRVRPNYPYTQSWIATGYTIQSSVEPRYIIFGKEQPSPKLKLYVLTSPGILTVGVDTMVVFTIISNSGPVSNVSVTVKGLNFLTDADGIVSIPMTIMVAGNITVTVSKPGYEDATVTLVVVPPLHVLTNITLSPSTTTVVSGQTQQFTATGLDQNNNIMSFIPFWLSTNDTVGTINSTTGMFTAITSGTAKITAFNATEGGTPFGTAKVTVIIPTPSPTLTPTPSPTVSPTPTPTPSPTSTPIPTIKKGDVNKDGIITIVDALFIAQYTVQSRTLIQDQITSADVNGDNKVTIVDALFIAQYTVGLRQL